MNSENRIIDSFITGRTVDCRPGSTLSNRLMGFQILNPRGDCDMNDIEITKELAREFALEIFDCLIQEIGTASEENNNDNVA